MLTSPPEGSPRTSSDAVELALVLLRTRPLGPRPDGLNRWSDLEPLLRGCGLSTRIGADPDAEQHGQAVAEARRLRDGLLAVILADTLQDSLRLLHDLTASPEMGPPELECDRGRSPEDAAAPVAAAAAVLLPPLSRALTEGVLRRVRVCPDQLCRTVFLDPVRGRPRRHCSPRCATRARMRRHRGHQPAQG